MLSFFDKYKKSYLMNEYNNINNIFLREIEHTKYDKQNYTVLI